jgi:hypothetical protein
MDRSKSITQKRYSLEEALKSVPVKDYKKVTGAVMDILEITSRQQLLLIRKGESAVSLPKAKAVEEYFLTNWGITDVWKEVTPMLTKALKQADVTKF